MQSIALRIAGKRAELDRLRARAPGGLANFKHSQEAQARPVRGGAGDGAGRDR